MKKIIPGILVLFLLAAVCSGQEKAAITLPDYKALAEECKKAVSVGCCLASVRAMEEGKYFQDTGKTFKETTCPEGYQPNMMRCPDSYRWCIPAKPAAQD